MGESEDALTAMFHAAATMSNRCILILDDVGFIYGEELPDPAWSSSGSKISSTVGESHIQARLRNTFLSCLDSVRRLNRNGKPLLVICTSKFELDNAIIRFHKVYELTNPSAQERKQLIEGFVFDNEESASPYFSSEAESLLSDVVDCTVGMSYAEIKHAIQPAAENCVAGRKDITGVQILSAMKQKLQSLTPLSLRNGVVDDFVDMTVVGGRQLINSSIHAGGELELPLYGDMATAAWQALERLILMPLCRARAVGKLIYEHGSKTRKGFVGGVLLTGPPGSGLTTMAYHCAAIASTLLASVKLLDVSCTSLIHSEVGSSERAVHRLFKSVRESAPCILLMDGIENVAAVRGNDSTTEGTMDRVLSTLLTELDGVDGGELISEEGAGFVVIGITHFVDWIDPALRRPGRLEKVIELGLPDYDSRRRIVSRQIEDSPSFIKAANDDSAFADNLTSFVARKTDGMTGAAVVAVCNEAKMLCARDHYVVQSTEGGSPSLSREHFIEAILSQGGTVLQD